MFNQRLLKHALVQFNMFEQLLQLHKIIQKNCYMCNQSFPRQSCPKILSIVQYIKQTVQKMLSIILQNQYQLEKMSKKSSYIFNLNKHEKILLQLNLPFITFLHTKKVLHLQASICIFNTWSQCIIEPNFISLCIYINK